MASTVAAVPAKQREKPKSASKVTPASPQRQAPALEAALRYGRLGYAVLPLAPGEKGPMTALVHHGLREATRQEDV